MRELLWVSLETNSSSAFIGAR